MSEAWLLRGGTGISIPHGLCKYVAGWCACEICTSARDVMVAQHIARSKARAKR